MDELNALTAAMAQEGIRRLLVISGSPAWSLAQAMSLRETLPGDWLAVSPQAMPGAHCLPGALVTLLGREFHHAIFDARRGFDVAAFAALGGTLRAGSWLVLLVPPLVDWPGLPDDDSMRWSDTPEPIATPHFVQHFCRVIYQHPQTLVWQQGQPLRIPVFSPGPAWHPATGEPDAEQSQVLSQLMPLSEGIAVLTAGRGRGKSALAGMLIRQCSTTAIVTAPAKAATDVLAAFAGDKFQFIAPDALLASDNTADWLIVDEAAAIPGPLLHKLTARFKRVLLCTTVQGYEGTGRGFLLKFCARFHDLRIFTLEQPLRWARDCPLEQVISAALLFHDETFTIRPQGRLQLTAVAQSAWQRQPSLPAALYQLLSGAHYRTSPLDLRRMMDAPGQHFFAAQSDTVPAGALWLVEEGGLHAALSQAVWAGFRRPRGNLVAQSLAAHGGSRFAATLHARRITRIAVHPLRQREGIGHQLVERACLAAKACDYLSVSFGYTPELWRFWQRCGFILVRIGTHREASSGCYTAMAIRPFSERGQAMAAHEHQRLRRDLPWLLSWIEETLSLSPCNDAMLNEDDWWELAGFAFAHRPLLACIGSLNRLLLQVTLALPALRGRLSQQSESTLCAGLGLSGRKALLTRLRQETASALASVDPVRADLLRQQVTKLQFF
ncbi:tRNA cytosine(34) acetyltransferase TmcA [Superficieibacter electus]|uniref:tRNA(Met) cytidine acetyltransferase TmcA n=2 Tax=Superficieibacter electus TaxID=2022662 RepID=A0A2P5GK29_9ENTR|nr:GNAT family N-acetyltransferase [Superficieibacter electus]POP42187.1 tRNA cytosine(34) acetyltransferase TmcA [Superficieibacter electus]POP44494.1 tRNA cytosine(34) acetyltransferase TmcA [Superficieibacter electus]